MIKHIDLQTAKNALLGVKNSISDAATWLQRKVSAAWPKSSSVAKLAQYVGYQTLSVLVLFAAKIDKSIYYGHKASLGDKILYGATNRATKEVRKGDLAREKAETLFEKIKGRVSAKDDKLETKLDKGICWGISLDLAERFLKGEEIESIMQSLRKGGSAESVANQAVYQNVNVTPAVSQDEFYKEIFNHAKEVNPDVGLFKVDFNQVLKMKASLEGVRLDTLPKAKDATIKSLNAKFDEEFEKVKTDSEKLKTLYEKRDAQILHLRWAVSLLELEKIMSRGGNFQRYPLASYGGQSLSDPVLNEVLLGSYEKFYLVHATEDVIAKARGIDLKGVEDKMGSSLFARDDAAYLSNFDKLNEGFYTMTFSTEREGGHAISFIKEAKGAGYIIDPNGMQLKFKDAGEAVELLKYVLKQYKLPPNLTQDKNRPYHQIQIYRCEKTPT